MDCERWVPGPMSATGCWCTTLPDPVCRPPIWTKLLRDLRDEDSGGLLAVPGADTLKFGPAVGQTAVDRTVDRTGLWRALTPQMFRFGALRKALEAAHDAGRTPTDESQALEWVGVRPLLVEGSAANIKVTTAQDLVVAAAILTSTGRVAPQLAEKPMRIGSGFDVHAFGEGDFVMLGGGARSVQPRCRGALRR